MAYQLRTSAIRAAAFSLLASTATAQSSSASVSVPQWPLQTFITEPTFKPPVFETNKTGKTAEGLIFYGPTNLHGDGETAVVITTDEGEMIWQGSPSIGASNLTPGTLDGKPILHYWAGELVTSIGRGFGYCTILDDTYTPIYNVTLVDDFVIAEPGSSEATSIKTFIDMHEQYLTDRDTLIVTAYNSTPYDLTPIGGPKNGWLLDALVYEIDIKTNNILFKWRASDHPKAIPLNGTYIPMSSGSGYGTNITEAFDYFHHNAIQDFEDGYLVSSRHFWTAFYISKKTGEVIWQIDGGNGADFKLGPGANFSWQHDVRVQRQEDGTILMHMHDNANYSPTEFNITKGLFLTVDDKAKTVTEKVALYDHKYPVASAAEGSCQPLDNGNVLMEYGVVTRAKEFNAAQNIVWEAQYGYYEQTSSYRMYRQTWSGFPKTRPKTSACKNSNGKVEVFMSWNGATNFDGWVIYSGNNTGKGKTSRTEIHKNSFETNTTIFAADYVTVEAVNCTNIPGYNAYTSNPRPVTFSETVKVNATCSI